MLIYQLMTFLSMCLWASCSGRARSVYGSMASLSVYSSYSNEKIDWSTESKHTYNNRSSKLAASVFSNNFLTAW